MFLSKKQMKKFAADIQFCNFVNTFSKNMAHE